MTRVPVQERRRIFQLATLSSNCDVWICECCGEDDEEQLAVYEIVRLTRAYHFREACLCVACASRIPHGVVISD